MKIRLKMSSDGILLVRPPRNIHQWNLNRNLYISIHEKALENIVCEMAVILPMGRRVLIWAFNCVTYSVSSSGVLSTHIEASTKWWYFGDTLQWRHSDCHGVSNHQRLGCLLNRLFRCRSNKTSELHITGLCEGNPPVTGGFPSQRASNVENVSIWWRHHELSKCFNKIVFGFKFHLICC